MTPEGREAENSLQNGGMLLGVDDGLQMLSFWTLSEKWKCEEFNIKFPVLKIGRRLGLTLKKYHQSGLQKSG